MKITKFDILDGLTTGLGLAGALGLILGGGACLGGASATGIIKAGEFLASAQPMYRKAMFYGGVGSGAGLFLIGAGAAAAAMRDKAGQEEVERITARHEEAVQRRVKPEDKQRTWTEWQEYERTKAFCRGCQYYQGGGLCALYSESRSGCGNRVQKRICSNCKYYSSEESLCCAVHPEGCSDNCLDWESEN